MKKKELLEIMEKIPEDKRNEDINFLQLSYGNFVSLDDYMLLKKENQQLKNIINKSTNELYIWGEILNPEFQKRMLEILEKSDKQ